ncbi:helix-turn-helix domain-containing protein, partial [Listeria valentina]|uniref:helix-turn-helix domain-containing protein n=1 Tax=Listeria valentina TaxID=2705293 RepID=UPI0014311F54
MERIQKNFKLIRETKKFSQRTLANGICSQSLISRFEAGKDIPSALILKKLCDRLQVKIDLLFKENSLLATEIEQNLFKAYLHKNYKLIESILEKRNLSIDYVEREFYRGVTIFHNQKAYFIALQSFEYALEKIVISKLGGEDYSELEPFICSYIGLCYIF